LTPCAPESDPVNLLVDLPARLRWRQTRAEKCGPPWSPAKRPPYG